MAVRGLDGRHEIIGAELLKKWFAPPVAEPVRLHVPAKSFLCLNRTRLLREPLFGLEADTGPAGRHHVKTTGARV